MTTKETLLRIIEIQQKKRKTSYQSEKIIKQSLQITIYAIEQYLQNEEE